MFSVVPGSVLLSAFHLLTFQYVVCSVCLHDRFAVESEKTMEGQSFIKTNDNFPRLWSVEVVMLTRIPILWLGLGICIYRHLYFSSPYLYNWEMRSRTVL